MEGTPTYGPDPSLLNTEYMHIFSLHRVRLGYGVRRVVGDTPTSGGIGRCTLGLDGGRGTLQLYHPPHPMAKPDPMKTEYMHIFSIQLAGVWGIGRCTLGVAGDRGTLHPLHPSPPHAQA